MEFFCFLGIFCCSIIHILAAAGMAKSNSDNFGTYGPFVGLAQKAMERKREPSDRRPPARPLAIHHSWDSINQWQWHTRCPKQNSFSENFLNAYWADRLIFSTRKAADRKGAKICLFALLFGRNAR
jgi:hypothetical protein